MTLEDQLREYHRVLDAATEDTAAERTSVAPVIRMHPARTLIVAAVAVAAAIAIAFAVVGTTDKRSTPPAGVTTTPPAPSTTSLSAGNVRVPNVIGVIEHEATADLASHSLVVAIRRVDNDAVPAGLVVAQSPPAGSPVRPGASVTLEVSSGPARGPTLSVRLTLCNTLQATTPTPTDPHAPSTITIATPPFTSPTLAAYSGTRGYLILTAPQGWQCRAIEATDGGQGVGVTPPGATPRASWGNAGHATTPLSDGVFGSSDDACQGCIRGEICGIVPTAAADFPDYASLPCPRPPGETVVDRGNDVYEYDDPAGTIGPDAARSILRYVRKTRHTDASLVSETCILPASESNVCDALFAEFLALRPTPWNQGTLTISPSALGAVQLGMTLDTAQSAAGETFDGHGDGFHYSRAHDHTGLHLFVGFGVNGTTVDCVGAEFWTGPNPTQRVVTPEGVALGDSVQKMLATYGSRAKYVPAPAAGMTTNAGYVVQENGGAIALSVYHGRVTELAGGASNLTPNSCTG